MKIYNFRMGFATNSSSSHSIIYIPPGQALPSDRDEDDEYFGWDNFTLTSEASKREYIAAQLGEALSQLKIPDYIAQTYLRTRLNVDEVRSVDHQSVWCFPKDREELPEQWIEDLEEYIVRNPNVVILGGNDNDASHPLSGTHESPYDLSSLYGFDKARRDEPGLWTFYSTKTGTKMTIDLDMNRSSRPRSGTPELVDIKITDYCPYGCAFCYQGSTTEGLHAPVYSQDYGSHNQTMYNIISQCREAGVFEIAYGGGEPTLHPKFVEILRLTSQSGITPSFTTKNLGFFRDKEKVTEVLQYVGGIAYSVENVPQIEAWGRVAAKYGGNSNGKVNRFTVHIVMGLQTLEELETMLRAVAKYKLHVTLLGYKTTGRGNDVVPHSYDGWTGVMQKLQRENACPSISIDTALALSHGSEIEAAGVPSYLFYRIEGRHSAYIDAVAGTAAPSSYARKEDHVKYTSISSMWSAIEGFIQDVEG